MSFELSALLPLSINTENLKLIILAVISIRTVDSDTNNSWIEMLFPRASENVPNSRFYQLNHRFTECEH